MNINSEVSLRPIDRDNIDAILLLKLAAGQEAHFAPNPFEAGPRGYSTRETGRFIKYEKLR